VSERPVAALQDPRFAGFVAPKPDKVSSISVDNSHLHAPELPFKPTGANADHQTLSHQKFIWAGHAFALTAGMVAPIAYPPAVMNEDLGEAVFRVLPPGTAKRSVAVYTSPSGRVVIHDGHRIYHVHSAYRRLTEQLREALEASAVEGRPSLLVDPETHRPTLLPMSEAYAMVCAQRSLQAN
jgi:hypothetical protein